MLVRIPAPLAAIAPLAAPTAFLLPGFIMDTKADPPITHQGRALAGPSLRFDVLEEVERLRRTTPRGHGHGAFALARYPDLRLVLIALWSGATIHEHKTEGRVSVQCIDGRVRMHVAGAELELSPGQLITIDRNVPHDIVAVGDSSVLLTIAWPER